MGKIPDDTIARAENALRNRLVGKRLKHSFGVAETATLLAEIYGLDTSHARVAGLLHDWDKQLSDEELLARVEEFDLKLPKKMLKVPPLLHAPTAAAAVRREFPELPNEVIQAIKHHTVPVKNMADLDKVLYIADKIEPTRPSRDTQKVWDVVGEVSLDELYFLTYQSSLAWMVGRGKPIYPDGFKVYNKMVKRREKARKNNVG